MPSVGTIAQDNSLSFHSSGIELAQSSFYFIDPNPGLETSTVQRQDTKRHYLPTRCAFSMNGILVGRGVDYASSLSSLDS